MQGRTKAALPGDVLGRIEPQQQIELLREQLILIRQVVAEQGERLREYAAAGDYLGTSAREQIDRGEVFEHLHRSAVLRIVTALASRTRVVTCAIAASTTGVAAIAKSSR